MKPKELEAYLKKNKLSAYDFSYKVKLTAATIYNFLNGEPSTKSTLNKIKKGMLWVVTNCLLVL